MPHALAAERDLETDRHTSAQTEVRDCPARLGDDRALTSDRRDVARRGVHGLGVPDRLAHADVQDDLLDLRDLHHVWIAELLAQLLPNALVVALLQGCRHQLGSRHDDRLAALLAHALFGAVLVHAMRDTGGLPAVRADDHDLAETEGHGLLDDAALLIL